MAHISQALSHRGRVIPPLPVWLGVALGMAFPANDASEESPKVRAATEGWDDRECIVPVGLRRWREASAATLACQTAGQLVHRLTEQEKEKIKALIYCHEATDARVPESTAGRLQHELGLVQARAFSISQCHNTSAYAALDLALALLHGPEQMDRVLVIASDKLVFPSMRQSTDSLRFGDTAAVMMLTRASTLGCDLQVVHAKLSHCEGMPNAFADWEHAAKIDLATRCASFLDSTLRECGLTVDRLSTVLNCGSDQTVEALVHASLGVTTAMVAGRPAIHSGSTSAADPIMAIEWLQAKGPGMVPALIWGAGNNGELGCCVLTQS